jgi:M6 family metalloprotease-like protein
MKKILIFGLLLLYFSGAYSRTVKICALRVEFQKDNDPLTTGNGLFMVDSTTADTNAIDRAPHNRTYFNDQLNAASNYYKTVTQNGIVIEGTIFPRQLKGAYKLDHKMGYYNPNTSEDVTNEGLSNLFTDAIEAAEASGDITFADYDLVVIFHAGVGKDVGLDFDETPKDIPSLYVSQDFLKKYKGDDFDGLPVDGGTHKVKQAIILPETENQQGISLAVTGIFVNNIGNYIGLYDLFSAEEQRSGVGRFDLMDAGLFNANGLIPSPLGAYSRQLMGFDKTAIIEKSQKNISLARLSSDSAAVLPTIVQIPINDDEYYLLEYRGNSELFLDSMYYEELNNSSDGKITYLQVLKKHFPTHITISDSSGVLLAVDDYDLGLSGSGVLIWHVDQRIISEKLSSNTINNDPEKRGVDIEEADGIEDIGQAYTFWDAGYQSDLGTWLDFWYSDNPAKLFKNDFSDNSRPNTKSNHNDASTFIKISNFSSNKTAVMTFDYEREQLLDGFPVQFGQQNSDKIYTVSGEIFSLNRMYHFTAYGTGNIYALDDAGRGMFANDKYLIAHIASADKNVSIALSDQNGSGAFDALYAVSNDSLFAFDLTQMSADSLAAGLFSPLKLAAKIGAPLVTVQAGVWVQCVNDSIYFYDNSGQIKQITASGNNVSDLILKDNGEPLNSVSAMSYVAISPIYQTIPQNIISYNRIDKQLEIYDINGSKLEQSFSVADSMLSQFSLADVDDDGAIDILYVSGNKLYVVNREGYSLTNFPLEIEMNTNDAFLSTPLLAKNAQGNIFIYAATKMGLIYGFDRNGSILSGFPLSSGGQLSNTSLLLSEMADGYNISAVTKDGNFYSWKLADEKGTLDILWGMSNFKNSNNVLVDNLTVSAPTVDNLLPENRVYNYPNPNSGDHTTIRYYLKEDAAVTIRILDMAGDMVVQFNAPGYGGVDNEKIWDVANIASGVYLCQIEAKTDTETVNRIIKILVVH